MCGSGCCVIWVPCVRVCVVSAKNHGGHYVRVACEPIAATRGARAVRASCAALGQSASVL